MKRLVVCADGTWNTPAQEGAEGRTSTNVLKLMRAVRPVASGDVQQIVFYDKGVGTGGTLDRFLGGAFGVGLSENVLDCYRFLANNHVAGDEIYLFGFSRGAFTVRSLGGLIGALGLVDKLHLGALRYGWDYYRLPPEERAGRTDLLEPLGERRTGIPIACIGVWDTVGSLGVPVGLLKNLWGRRHAFHDTRLGADVRTALHAVSIDERRKPFEPTLWTGRPAPDQTVEQVWFAGVHSNVGGGYPDAGLSDVALEWMLGRVAAHTGLESDPAYTARHVAPQPTATLYESFTRWYRLLGPHVREIAGNADVHPSVRTRMEETDYRPGNLPD
jgi:uncharacterized protein (DUF2235 family)